MNTTDQTATTGTACKCGCGEGTQNTYRPGHDARHVSILLANWARARAVGEGAAVNESDLALKALPSPALKAKFLTARDNAEVRIQAKAERQANREARRAQAKADKLAATKGAGDEDRLRHEHEASLSAKVEAEQAEFNEAEAAKHYEITADGGEIKVGRWTYPTGSQRGDDTTYRNAKRDGSGEWILVG